MTFSEKLYQLRKSKGLSQEQLAEQLSVSRQAISKWESAAAMPETEKLLVISKYFGVSIDYLLNEECLSDCHDQESESNKKYEADMKGTGATTNLLGSIICIAGVIGLILWGVITIFSPEASSQISKSSAIHIDGNGIFLILCMIAIVSGAAVILKKSR